MSTKVAILGAGCSCSYGYPLANQMKDQLKKFEVSIRDSAPKLVQMAERTLALFEQLPQAQTVDDLAWLLHQGKIDAPKQTFQDEHNDQLVEGAKVVVSAMFLQKEREAAKVLTGYRNFLRRIFPNATRCERALAESPWRILTFNYDRLFELAFRQHFTVDMTETFYGETRLNSGLLLMVPEEVRIDTSRFSFLKLHGSVGFLSLQEYGRCGHYHSIPDPAKPVTINDEEFFYGSDCGIHSNQPKLPLIVFPHEKIHLTEFEGNTFPFRYYIPETWHAAKEFLREAEEICIVGYSVPEPDWPAFESLVMIAERCRRIVVQGPAAESICRRLKGRMPNFAERIYPCESTFESGLAI